MNISAFDPGETTAFVRASVELTDTGARVTIEAIGEWQGMHGLVALRGDAFFDAEHVVIEDYIVYPSRAQSHAGDRVITAREIGRIEWLAFMRKAEIVFQAASLAKQRWPNSRIRDYVSKSDLQGRTRHELDALRHLFTHVERDLIDAKAGETIDVHWWAS